MSERCRPPQHWARRAAACEALTDATGRVLAVAQVHRRLYTSNDVQSVSVDQYLTGMMEDLRRSSDTNALGQLTLSADPIRVDPDRAVAVGVIVNELVMNALKYAYPDSTGPIRVVLKDLGNNRAVVCVEDDGVGMEPRATPKSTGLGQRIVRAMGEKLGAKIEFDRDHKGTRVMVRFNLQKMTAPRPAA